MLPLHCVFTNAKQPIITMMQVGFLDVWNRGSNGGQVYEYFILHHMAKAFESVWMCYMLTWLFHSVSVADAHTHKPLLISNQMVQDYSRNRVDTLHLLQLGED